MTALPGTVRTRRSDALRGRAFTGQTQYATRACTRSVCFKQRDCSSVPSTVSANTLGETKLFVDEPPLVTRDDIAAGIEELDVHRHCDGLLGREEDDTIVHGVLKPSALASVRRTRETFFPGSSTVPPAWKPSRPQFSPRLATLRRDRASPPPPPATPRTLQETGGTTGSDDRPVARFSPSRPPSASHIA